MYPFKTDKQKIVTSISEKEVEEFFRNRIRKKKLIQVTADNVFYGKVESRHAKFELGQYPSRNSFTPIVILRWDKIEDETVIECYCRLDYRIVLTFLVLPLSGLYISIEQKTVIPLIVMSVIAVFFIFGLIQFAYNRSKNSTLEMLYDLFSRMK